jgi:hypothetical protein
MKQMPVVNFIFRLPRSVTKEWGENSAKENSRIECLNRRKPVISVSLSSPKGGEGRGEELLIKSQKFSREFPHAELDNNFISTTSPRPSPPFHGGEGDGSRGSFGFSNFMDATWRTPQDELPNSTNSGTLR